METTQLVRQIHSLRPHPAKVNWAVGRCVAALCLLRWTLVVGSAQPSNSVAPPAATVSAIRVRVTGFSFEPAATNHPLVFTTNVLAKLVAQYVGREVDDTDLEAARRLITEYYVKHGYLNSGAVLPDQDLKGGIVTFMIVEGRLSEVYVHGTKRLKAESIRQRVRLRVTEPLKLDRLADSLDAIRDNPNVRRLIADLQPVKKEGAIVPGESVLDLQVEEASPYRLELVADNYRPASVGAEELQLLASDFNLTGHSDALDLQYGLLQRSKHQGVEFSGADNLSVAYSIPVTVRDTTLGGFYDRRNYAVVEEPFNTLDIDSRYEAYGLRLQQPLYRGGGHYLGLSLSLERRRSEGFLLGQPFSFAAGTIGGVSEVTALRLSADWNRSWARDVLGVRLTASWGLDALGATHLPTGPDGRFVSVLGQWQYARRLFTPSAANRLAGTQFLFRGGFQWASDPLVGMEEFSLGGPSTVRGYRVNQLVRDTGVFGTAELQIPLVPANHGFVALQLAPFFDYGAGWDLQSSHRGLDSLSSVGASLIMNLGRRFNARLDYGYALRNAHNPNKDPQDLGLLFRVGYRVF